MTILILEVIAAALAKQITIRSPLTWIEPVNLSVLITLPRANRKSAAFGRATPTQRAFEAARRSGTACSPRRMRQRELQG